MGRLATLLRYAIAEKGKRAKMLESERFKTIVGEKAFKTLQQNEDITETTLLQEEVLKTIFEGAEPAKCFRDVLPIIKTKSYSVRVVTSTGGEYAAEVPEAAPIPIDTTSLSKVDITIKKVGTRPLITRELIDDALFDVVELELRKAGARMENKLNRDCLLEVLSGITNTDIDPAGSTLAVTDLANAVGTVKSKNYTPDTLITHPAAEAQLLQDSNLVYVAYAGTRRTLETGEIPRILGLRPWTCSVTTGSTSYYWDSTDADSHYYALVFDSQNMAMIAMRQDMTTEQYHDPIHDLVGISVTMRYGVKTIQGTAGVRILTK